MNSWISIKADLGVCQTNMKSFHVIDELNVNDSSPGRSLNHLRDWCETRWGKVPRNKRWKKTSIKWFIVGNHLFVSDDAELTEFQLSWL